MSLINPAALANLGFQPVPHALTASIQELPGGERYFTEFDTECGYEKAHVLSLQLEQTATGVDIFQSLCRRFIDARELGEMPLEAFIGFINHYGEAIIPDLQDDGQLNGSTDLLTEIKSNPFEEKSRLAYTQLYQKDLADDG